MLTRAKYVGFVEAYNSVPRWVLVEGGRWRMVWGIGCVYLVFITKTVWFFNHVYSSKPNILWWQNRILSILLGFKTETRF